MNQEPQELLKPITVSSTERFNALLEIFLCSGLVSTFIAYAPLSLFKLDEIKIANRIKFVFITYLIESIILIGMITYFQRLNRQNIKDLGLKFHTVSKDIVIGLGIIPGLFLINWLVSLFFRYYLPRYALEKNPLLEIISTRLDLILFMIMAVIAGFKEELQRAFILVRFEKYLFGAYLGLIVWSIAFGALHYLQHFQGAVTTGLLGLCFGVVYLLRRNIISPIFAHASYNFLALLFFGYSSHL